MASKPCLRVRLIYFDSATNRRTRPLENGYRGSFWWGEFIDTRQSLYDATVLVERSGKIQLGDSAVVTLVPTGPQFWRGLTVGQHLDMFEGTYKVGTAEIITALNTPDE